MNSRDPYAFISYSSSNRIHVQTIIEALTRRGVAVWFDQQSIDGGDIWSSRIVDGIRNCAVVLLVYSPESMQSRNVQQEVQLAWENNRPILPLVIEQSALPPQIEYALAGRHWIVVSGVNDNAWLDKTLRALQGFGLKSGIEHAPPAHALDTVAGERSEQPGLIPTNLSYPAFPIVGRDVEVVSIMAMLDSSRLVTMTGTGGAGKTRLSFEVGHRVLPLFRDGVFEVQLVSISQSSLLASVIARVLDVREVQGQSLMSSLKAYIYKRSMLLLLDNFEHIADGRNVVRELLEACPNLKVLVTSRVRLGLGGEQEFLVEPLGLPVSTSLESIHQSAAVQLFVKRACRVRHDFTLTDDNASTIAAICRRLDGLPLAIELAATRVKTLSLKAILARLSERMKLLSGGISDLPERHQTLRTAIAWSYELLGEDDRSMFCFAGVFAGGFALERVEELLAEMRIDIDGLACIGSLVDHSLLVYDTGNDEARFTMLMTIQEFSVDRLRDQGLEDSVRRAHATVYAALAEQAEPDFRAARCDVWDEVFRREQDNIRMAFRWSMDHGDSQSAVRIVGSLAYWFFRELCAESSVWIDEVLRACSDSMSDVERMRVLKTAGQVAWGMGNVVDTARYLLAAEPLARAQADPHLLCDMLTWLILAHLADPSTARTIFEEAMVLARNTNEKWLQAAGHVFLGLVEGMNGNLPQMAQLLDESIAISREIDDSWALAGALMFRGALFVISGDLDQASAVLAESLPHFDRVHDRKNAGAVFNLRGGIERVRGRWDQSHLLHVSGLEMCKEIGEPGGIHAHLCDMALLALAEGSFDRSITIMAAASELQRNSHATAVPMTDILSRDAPARVGELRDMIGKEAFDASWRCGERLSLDEAIEYACSR